MTKAFLPRIFCLFVLIFTVFPSFAADSTENSDVKFNIWGSGEIFALNPLTDGLLLGAGITLSGTDLLFDTLIVLNRQEYDGKFYDKNDVNSLDRIFMNSYSKPRDKAADILVATSVLTPAVLFLNPKEEWLTCGIMYAEALMIANGIKFLTKFSINRARPYMYYNPSTFPKKGVDDGDWANSFPSGHTTMAFTGATFTSYTFCKYFPTSNLRIPVIAGSYAMAFGVAALRLSSGNHFMTDVVAGAILGTSVGFLVPWIHTFNTKHNELNLALLPNGVSVGIRL